MINSIVLQCVRFGKRCFKRKNSGRNIRGGTTDFDMRDFVSQQFSRRCLSSLALFNEWLEKKLIVFDSKPQETIKDWAINNEPIQPSDDIEKFERLTGCEYVGPG